MKKIDFSINSFSLSFYSSEEIRKLAVKQITSLTSIEPILGKGATNGLYDSELGPLREGDSCRNCNLSYYECNGHFGRIEFVKPIYNPILFDYLVKLIKGVCFYCHRLSYSNGLLEVVHDLGSQDDRLVISRYNDLEEIQSMSKSEKEKMAVKIMSKLNRALCQQCSKKSLVFTKSRKAEILVHVSKVHGKSDEPKAKRMKLENTETHYQSNYSAQDLYSRFTEEDSPIPPDLLREHLRILWTNESENLGLIFPLLKDCKFEYPTDVFFMDNMLINPPMNRMPSVMQAGEHLTESPETMNMSDVVRTAATLQKIVYNSGSVSKELQFQNIREAVLELQRRVNECYDSNTHRELRDSQPGLRQKIDKKLGLFRANIMGKRVNFSCRSVISPDPNIGLDEIGVPVIFLMKLMFPEPMNSLNKEFLRQCILNGPDVYPGALNYKINDKAPVSIFKNRESTAEYLAVQFQSGNRVIINRHAINGDVLIMNRQPTLHRPSMQAHYIKAILDPHAKTLRMHYSNCKAYNADFDGDEMNGHFMQSIEAQAEAKLIVNVCHQHSTPKDGSPLAGLIQDHVIAGTRMCMRDCFMERREYLDLVMFGLKNSYTPPLRLLKPALMKPFRLWTGKQVLSTIIINSVPAKARLPNIEHQEPKKNAMWRVSPEEQALRLSDVELVIRDGYVCTGIFDKVHIGPAQKGLCSDLRELYGPQAALHMLTCFSRVLNRFLIYTGFSTNVKDGFLNRDGDDIRHNLMNKVRSVGLTSIATAFRMQRDKLQTSEISELMEKAHFDCSDEFRNKMAEIDSRFKSLSMPLVNKLGTVCKDNLKERFPINNLTFMSSTGAKGGDSNVTKIAIGLGAIEIEGKRCPLTLGGRTLPSFRRYDFDPASRGFCVSRFTSGLNPQEVYFESMAGRDGLVDTAVKTSISGYLQRCIIKHLEDVTISFDNTVRDNMHNIIQFRYGYDGLDIINSSVISRSDFRDIISRNIMLYHDKYLNKKDFPVEFMNERVATERILQIKTETAQVSPGEAVGLLAAQSIGEPSTQMTLNTFHNAGQSEMNVTLGIPRLKEILMTGAETIKTQTMSVPILEVGSQQDTNVALVFKKFNKLLLKDVIQLPLKLDLSNNYEITLTFKEKSSYEKLTNLSQRALVKLIEVSFIQNLARTLKKCAKMPETEEIRSYKAEEMCPEENVFGDLEERNELDTDPVYPKKEEVKDNSDDEDNIEKSDTDSNHGDSNTESDEEIGNDTDNSENKYQIMKEEAVVQERKPNVNKKQKVLNMCLDFFKKYQVDSGCDPKWIKLTINMGSYKIDMKSILLNMFETTVISCVEGIDKAIIITKTNVFATEGYNNRELFKYDNVFNLNRFYSNNIVKMAKLYGIEAAISCIENEVMSVFKAYSIDISSRHLRLIADFLTFSGSIGAFNRHTMKDHPSQIQRASFETALTVLKEMIVHANVDYVKSPSSNIMLGQPVSNIGTNSTELLFNKNLI